jgi:hypothetical protein
MAIAQLESLKLEAVSCQLSPLSDFVKAQSFSVMFRE